MISKIIDPIIGKYHLNLGTYYFYNNYFVANINEGEVINVEKLDDLIPLVVKHYGDGRPFTYISDRINSHSIVPTDYLKCPLDSLKNFKGYGVVSYSRYCKISIEVEKHFAKRPFYSFNNIQDAIKWTKETITNS